MPVKIIIGILFLAVLLLVGAGVSHGQQVCNQREGIVTRLANRYNEQVIGQGLAGGTVVEILASESGTFTILYSDPSGVSCIIYVGTGWQTQVLAKGTKS